jgi:hypothetical protein
MHNHLFTLDIVIQSFFAKHFDWWLDCDWHLDTSSKTLHIICPVEGLRGKILRDSGKLSRTNIGIDKFVISRPGYQDFSILCLSRYSFSEFLMERI